MTKKLENLLSFIEAYFSIAFLLSKHLQIILLDFISSKIKILMLFFSRLLLFGRLIEEHVILYKSEKAIDLGVLRLSLCS